MREYTRNLHNEQYLLSRILQDVTTWVWSSNKAKLYLRKSSGRFSVNNIMTVYNNGINGLFDAGKKIYLLVFRSLANFVLSIVPRFAYLYQLVPGY